LGYFYGVKIEGDAGRHVARLAVKLRSEINHSGISVNLVENDNYFLKILPAPSSYSTINQHIDNWRINRLELPELSFKLDKISLKDNFIGLEIGEGEDQVRHMHVMLSQHSKGVRQFRFQPRLLLASLESTASVQEKRNINEMIRFINYESLGDPIDNVCKEIYLVRSNSTLGNYDVLRKFEI